MGFIGLACHCRAVRAFSRRELEPSVGEGRAGLFASQWSGRLPLDVKGLPGVFGGAYKSFHCDLRRLPVARCRVAPERGRCRLFPLTCERVREPREVAVACFRAFRPLPGSSVCSGNGTAFEAAVHCPCFYLVAFSRNCAEVTGEESLPCAPS